MKKRELLTHEIERREIARLSKTYPDITHEAIRGIFHVGFGFGLCEGIGAAKRRASLARIEEKVGMGGEV